MGNHNGKSAQLIFKLSTHTKQNKARQFTSNMKYELGAFVRVMIELLLPLLLVLHVTCEQLKLRKLRVGISDCLWVGYLLGSSFNSI